ncbi:hypothetical protein, conserved [Eimeria tenella]|uniref:Uncharacterized protein n=1 Tax=Eimeria tenella TaxID=5802 RepID=U6KXD7_EIMTE|nr:hypothetical protein, conserved [Eimeria tenella]CDJ40989.1 hypothetical protein, conserved [Eimeria tenella]|eukprot:XP_013231739.1 hypothetical protein, conserved [Eimeria tenella]
MKPQSEWAAAAPDKDRTRRDPTLQSFPTSAVNGPELQYAGTAVVKEVIKSTEEVVKEMRTWLKTGIAPDGTRMMTDEASQWYQDFYQATLRADKEHECLPEGSLVDYYYWKCPFLAHIGPLDLVMMHSQVNLRDGTHLPCDRLREATKNLKTLEGLARKRMEIERRQKETLLAAALQQHRGHPLRKEGFYTRYFWRPFHQHTIQQQQQQLQQQQQQQFDQQPERIPTVVREAEEHSAELA